MRTHLKKLMHLLALLAILSPALLCSPGFAQVRSGSDVHYFLNSNQAPGVVAGAQVARGMPGVGTYTAVSVSGPENLNVSLARDGQFLQAIDAPVTTGMLVGAVYRFRVTNIPFRPGEELFPTVEIIDRVNAPSGREHRFPIPVVLTDQDLRLALDGALITRVIYVEDSENAEPFAASVGEQRTFDVGPSANALKTADQFGRPVAILRIGSRIPANLQGDLTGFLYGCPPWIPLPPIPDRESLIRQGKWPEVEPVEHPDQPYSETPVEDVPRTSGAYKFSDQRFGEVLSVSHQEPLDQSPSDHGALQISLDSPSVSINEVVCADDGSAFLESAGCGHPGCGSGGCGYTQPPMSQPINVQEYIFDGGDQSPAVVVRKDWTAVGVNPTDTVIYYETLDGKVCVRPSNRVRIYAPRFGAVRQVTGIVLAARAVGTERILAPVTAVGFRETDLAGNLSLPVAPQGEQQVGMLDAFQENNGGVPIAQVLPPMRMSEAQLPFENVDFFTTGLMLDHEIPVLGRILANARTWYTPESVGVMIDGQAAALVIDAKRSQDVHVYEMPDRCAMRICKAASHSLANSGDIVRFTIRFDNVGPKPLGNAVILDSLTPRLEYIEESQQCSVDAKFTTDANNVGSLVLRWEIESPVKAGEGGVISFDCRVR